jgi:hypothetical protein
VADGVGSWDARFRWQRRSVCVMEKGRSLGRERSGFVG